MSIPLFGSLKQHFSNFLLWLQQGEKHSWASLFFFFQSNCLEYHPSKFRRFSLKCYSLLPTWVIHTTIKAQFPIKDDYVLKRHYLIVKLSSCWVGCRRMPEESFEGKCLFHLFLKLLVFTLEGRCKCLSFTVWGTLPWRQEF